MNAKLPSREIDPLPTGTVTFLFTDIEGSTMLAQQFPAELPALLARHHAILHGSIAVHHGHVFQITGDAFCAAFHTASDALQAALDAQRGLQHQAWNPAPIKVRMGIHTGAAQAGAIEERAGGYVGYLTLTRVQRVMSTAYGEQVLLSNPTAELVRGDLPADVSLQDVGEHRLKGLLNPEHLWQLIAPELRQDFLPLQSLNAIPNTLPVHLTSFIGREKEIAEVKQELNEHRQVTLTGSGGTGKTRLSLQVAADVIDHFEQGVWFVELAPLVDPALIPQTILSVMGISEQPGKVPLEILKDYLHDKKVLLVLDNCEHLIEASAQVVNALLRAAPQIRVLASSREALGVRGEVAYHVPSLSSPDPKHLPAIEQLSQYEAVRLFIDRTLLVAAHFDVTKENAPFIAQICDRLDGIPLAIELAATRVKMMSVEQISKRLDDRFRLLTGGARTALPRQQTLRALIDWSYSLLAENERLLLRRLSVFAGGWTLEAAEEACADDVGADRRVGPAVDARGGSEVDARGGPEADTRISPYEVLDVLSQLVNKSLVVVMERSSSGETRYRMLETIRQYARDKLLDSGQVSAVRDRHLDYFRQFCDEAYTNLLTAREVEWRRRVRAEQDNVRAAVEWGLENQPEAALRLSGELSMYWNRMGYAREGCRWLEAGLERVAALPPAEGEVERERQFIRALGLLRLGIGMVALGEVAAAKHCAEESLLLWRKLGGQRERADALITIGICAQYLGDAVTALAAVKEAVAIARTVSEPAALAFALDHAAWIIGTLGHDIATARSYLEESIGIYRSLGAEQAAATPFRILGMLEYVLGNYAQARAAFERSLAEYLATDNPQEANMARSGLADAESRLGHYAAALKLYHEVIPEWQKMGNRGGIARCLECVAFLLLHQAENETAREFLAPRATRLLGAAEKLREAIDATMTPPEQSEYADEVARLHERLDETALKAAWAEGRALTMEQAIEFALSGGEET